MLLSTVVMRQAVQWELLGAVEGEEEGVEVVNPYILQPDIERYVMLCPDLC
jgi:hypothetical protein